VFTVPSRRTVGDAEPDSTNVEAAKALEVSGSMLTSSDPEKSDNLLLLTVIDDCPRIAYVEHDDETKRRPLQLRRRRNLAPNTGAAKSRYSPKSVGPASYVTATEIGQPLFHYRNSGTRRSQSWQPGKGVLPKPSCHVMPFRAGELLDAKSIVPS
jgi:hypothetical protein